MKNSLMPQFLEVSEVGSQSIKKYEHPRLALRKIQGELLAMRDDVMTMLKILRRSEK